ncbi:MAG: hypothetical protein JWO82_60 [Akkermansiaceae bacterium]|nr:hypothetical protein [Akkermansiaceae bacterium]
MSQDPPAPDSIHLLLQNSSGSCLRLVGDPTTMLGFCRALRESVATAGLTGNPDSSLILKDLWISADYDYHLSFRLTSDIASSLATHRRKSRFIPLVRVVFWLIIATIIAIALRGFARVVFGL